MIPDGKSYSNVSSLSVLGSGFAAAMKRKRRVLPGDVNVGGNRFSQSPEHPASAETSWAAQRPPGQRGWRSGQCHDVRKRHCYFGGRSRSVLTLHDGAAP